MLASQLYIQSAELQGGACYAGMRPTCGPGTLQMDEAFVPRPGAALAAAAFAASDGPTAPLRRPAGAEAGPSRNPGAPAASAATDAAGSAADPDQTLPISRPAAAAGSRCGIRCPC